MVFTQQVQEPYPVVKHALCPTAIESLLAREWLLTNHRGGYASSTIMGCHTRAYHGLLIGALMPPVKRVAALSNCRESLIIADTKYELSTFAFDRQLAPNGYRYLTQFRQDVGVHFDYTADTVTLTKSLYLVPYYDTAILVYHFPDVQTPMEFQWQPFIALRDFHERQRASTPFGLERNDQGYLIFHPSDRNEELFLSCPGSHLEQNPDRWYRFTYRVDQQRGQEAAEDLWTPGVFRYVIDTPTRIIIQAHLSNRYHPGSTGYTNLDTLIYHLCLEQQRLLDSVDRTDKTMVTLRLAADAFVVSRPDTPQHRTTILAGYPWFADWGRDTFIALPGLLLAFGEYEKAGDVLLTFARAADQGMIPNRFDDRLALAHFNSVDASLWFIDAAFQYLYASNDTETFSQQLMPVIQWIIESYQSGTRFHIHADQDGLITAGDPQTQLTWMDAKCNGVAYTPRHGKAVEVNALWYNALSALAQYFHTRNQTLARHYQNMADLAGLRFCEVFWNEQKRYLNDTIHPDGTIDSSLRPNQIFALSLPHVPPLSPGQRPPILRVVEKQLLTPYGLRTLSPD